MLGRRKEDQLLTEKIETATVGRRIQDSNFAYGTN